MSLYFLVAYVLKLMARRHIDQPMQSFLLKTGTVLLSYLNSDRLSPVLYGCTSHVSTERATE